VFLIQLLFLCNGQGKFPSKFASFPLTRLPAFRTPARLLLLTVDASGVLDEETAKHALVDVLHLGHLLDAAVFGSLLDVVLPPFDDQSPRM